MKATFTLFIFTLLISFTLPLSAQSLSEGELSRYNNAIVAEHQKVKDKVFFYLASSVHNYSEENTRHLRSEVIRQLDQSIGQLQQLPAVQGDRRYHTEVIAIMASLKESFIREYQQVEALKNQRENSFEAMESYFRVEEEAVQKLQKLNLKFHYSQMNFASRHHMSLLMDTREDPLEIVASVSQYSHRLFLEYFRAARLNNTFLADLESGKLSRSADRRQELLDACRLAMLRVNEAGAFQEDNQYKEKTLQTIAIIRSLAENEYQEMLNLRQREDQLTDAEASRYNEIIELINKKVPAAMQEFNQTRYAFLQRYIPDKPGTSLAGSADAE